MFFPAILVAHGLYAVGNVPSKDTAEMTSQNTQRPITSYVSRYKIIFLSFHDQSRLLSISHHLESFCDKKARTSLNLLSVAQPSPPVPPRKIQRYPLFKQFVQGIQQLFSTD